MKNVLFMVGHAVLFVAFFMLFLAGGFLAVVHADPFGAPHWFVSHPAPMATRYFVPSGLLLMTLLWLIVLGIETATRRLRTAGLWTTVMYVLALVIGLVARFGWVTTS